MSHGCEHAGMSSYMRMMDIKMNHCCGGHSHNSCGSVWSHYCGGGGTSFWNGAGAGLAYGLVNWAMSGLSNWIGGMGFGGGNWFGNMGWGNIGLGGGNYGYWGLNGTGNNGATGSRSTDDDYYSRRYGSSTRSSSSEGADGADGARSLDDIDNAKIADITDKIAKLNIGNVSDGDYNAIKKQIEDAKGATDKINEAHDIKTYDNLLKLLNDKKNGIVTPEGATVTINGKPVFIVNLNPSQVKGLSKEEIDKVVTGDKAKEIAIQLLIEAGALDDENDKDIDATTNYSVLYLASKAGLTLKCGHNLNLDDIEGADAFLHGKITDVNLTENKVTFIVEDKLGKHTLECEQNGTEYKLVSSESEKLTKYTDNVIYKVDGYGHRAGTKAFGIS